MVPIDKAMKPAKGPKPNNFTANIARILNLPIILIVNAKGQAGSISALVRGFQSHQKNLKIAGVVLNNVNSSRHKKLLIETREERFTLYPSTHKIDKIFLSNVFFDLMCCS